MKTNGNNFCNMKRAASVSIVIGEWRFLSFVFNSAQSHMNSYVAGRRASNLWHK